MFDLESTVWHDWGGLLHAAEGLGRAPFLMAQLFAMRAARHPFACSPSSTACQVYARRSLHLFSRRSQSWRPQKSLLHPRVVVRPRGAG